MLQLLSNRACTCRCSHTWVHTVVSQIRPSSLVTCSTICAVGLTHIRCLLPLVLRIAICSRYLDVPASTRLGLVDRRGLSCTCVALVEANSHRRTMDRVIETRADLGGTTCGTDQNPVGSFPHAHQCRVRGHASADTYLVSILYA